MYVFVLVYRPIPNTISAALVLWSSIMLLSYWILDECWLPGCYAMTRRLVWKRKDGQVLSMSTGLGRLDPGYVGCDLDGYLRSRFSVAEAVCCVGVSQQDAFGLAWPCRRKFGVVVCSRRTDLSRSMGGACLFGIVDIV